jgi:hypothetical protein
MNKEAKMVGGQTTPTRRAPASLTIFFMMEHAIDGG